jgi:hypothetical protein
MSIVLLFGVSQYSRRARGVQSPVPLREHALDFLDFLYYISITRVLEDTTVLAKRVLKDTHEYSKAQKRRLLLVCQYTDIIYFIGIWYLAFAMTILSY